MKSIKIKRIVGLCLAAVCALCACIVFNSARAVNAGSKFDISTNYSMVRLTDGGLRFVSRINKSAFDAANSSGSLLEMGTLIIPSKVLGDMNLDLSIGSNAVRIVRTKWFNEDWATAEYTEFSAVLKSIPDGNNTTRIKACAYVTYVNEQGETITEYGNVYETSINQAASEMLADTSYGMNDLYKYQVNTYGRKVYSRYNAAQVMLIKHYMAPSMDVDPSFGLDHVKPDIDWEG